MAGPVLERPPPGRARPRRRSGRALWTPLTLLRSPGAFIPVLGAALVLGLTAAAGHLFLSSTGTAALDQDIAGTSSSFAGLTAIFDGPVSSDRVEYRDHLLREATAGVAGLGAP